MKRLYFGLFMLVSMLLAEPVMADGTQASWTINSGPNVGLSGAYPSAPQACSAWYQHWQSVFGNLGVSASITYESPYVVTNPSAPTATTEFCKIPVSFAGTQFVESSFLTRSPSCQSNETFDPDTDQCVASNTDAGKNAGAAGDCNGSASSSQASCEGTVMATDPINTATGNKFQQDTDFHGTSWLTFRRFYNSTAVLPSTLGPQWRHSFDRSLSIQLGGVGSSTTPTIRLYRPDGKSESFEKVGGVWTPDADVPDTLTEQDDGDGNPSGYTVFTALNREYERYSPIGRLQSITNASGQTATLTYSTASTPASVAPTSNLLLTVTDPNGRQLNLTYNNNGTLAQVTQPDGGTLTYAYDPASGNLSSVQYPDSNALKYVYNEASLTNGTSQPTALTGVIDETGTRFASTGYTNAGQATSFTFAGGANASSVIYNGSGSSTLSTPLGTSVGLVAVIDGFGTLKLAGASTPCGKQCTQPWQEQTYDANGYPSSYTDFNNNVTATTYNSAGLLTQKVDAQGTAYQRTTNTTWNTTLRVPLTRAVIDNQGNTVALTGWVYNNAGQILAQCDIDPTVSAAAGYACSNAGGVPAGVRRSTYTYCTVVDSTHCPVVGLLLTATGPRTDLTQITTYAYYLTDSASAHHGDLQSVTDALGHVTTYLSYDGAGRVLSQQDANGVITAYTYYPRGWVKTQSADGATTSFTYTAYGSIQTVTDPDGVTITFGYDAAHRLTTIADGQNNYIRYTLDASGNRTAENIYAAGSSTASHTLTRQFNALGQLTKVIDGLNHAVFDASAAGSYDANGNLMQSLDANGIAQKNNYDALNHMVKSVANYNGADIATRNTITQTAYDAQDRLTQVIDPNGLITTYGYDGLSDAISLQSPDAGSASSIYDVAGNVLTHTDAKGVVNTSVYDALNRRIGISYSDNAQANDNVTYAYDEANSITGCVSSYPVGRLTRIVEGAVTTVYCYDARGNVTRKQQITSAGTDSTTYTYTLANRLSSIIYPSGTLVSYTFDADGRIQGVDLTPPGANASQAVSNITYLPFGPISSYTLGSGQTITRLYDANYALTDLTSPALTLHFSRDLMGNINAEGSAPGASPAAESYTYDPLYRLMGITQGNTNIEALTYDPTGDRTSKAGGALSTGSYSYQANTHWLTGIGNAVRTYDANGNTVGSISAGQTWAYAYNGRNRLIIVQANGATIGTYTYNALGERIQKAVTTPTVATLRFDYNELGQLVGEYGNGMRDYVWLGTIPVAIVDIDTGGSNAVNYITSDHLGTPRAVSDSNGNVLWQWAWLGNPFGELAPTSESGYTLNLRYPGQYYDEESGTLYNLHRDYDSTIGRYQQADPTGFNGGINLYAYVGGNPVTREDPSGLGDTNYFGTGLCPGGFCTLPQDLTQNSWGISDRGPVYAYAGAVGIGVGALVVPEAAAAVSFEGVLRVSALLSTLYGAADFPASVVVGEAPSAEILVQMMEKIADGFEPIPPPPSLPVPTVPVVLPLAVTAPPGGAHHSCP